MIAATKVTLFILIVTGIVSFTAFNNRDLMHRLLFIPYEIRRKGQWYRFLSHGLLHADWMHLLVNMFVLWEFGRTLEYAFRVDFGPTGSLLYLILYILALAISSTWSFIRHRDDPQYSALGASGAVSAVLFAYILFNPMRRLSLMLLPFIPINAVVFGAIYLVYSAYMARRGGDNIGHDAHFWGAVFGFLFPILIRPAYFMEFLEKTGILR